MLAEKIEEFDIIGHTWDKQGVKWTPKQLSHYYDKPREIRLRETVIPSVKEVYKAWIEEIRNTMKIKNGHLVSCEPYARSNERILDFLARFVKEKYTKAFSNIEFTDITEQFLKTMFFYRGRGCKKEESRRNTR